MQAYAFLVHTKNKEQEIFSGVFQLSEHLSALKAALVDYEKNSPKKRILPKKVRYAHRLHQKAIELLSLVSDLPNGFDYRFNKNLYGEYVAKYLEAKGHIRIQKGWWNRELRDGRSPRITAVPSLREALKSWEGRIPLPVPEIPESKKHAAKLMQNWIDCYRRHDIRGCAPPVVVRYLRTKGKEHGRIYALGRHSFQQLSDRTHITIDGERLVDLDISASFLTILIGIYRNELPRLNTLMPLVQGDKIQHDPYSITGIEPSEQNREAVKKAILLTIQNRQYPRRWQIDGTYRRQPAFYKEPIFRQYPFLQNLPEGTPEKVCFLESEAMKCGGDSLIEKYDIPPLTTHDSLLAPVSRIEECIRIIEEGYFRFCGLIPIIKTPAVPCEGASPLDPVGVCSSLSVDSLLGELLAAFGWEQQVVHNSSLFVPVLYTNKGMGGYGNTGANLRNSGPPRNSRGNPNFKAVTTDAQRQEVLALYQENQSERKVAQALGLSKTTVHRIITNS